jgi:hypothetical protein
MLPALLVSLALVAGACGGSKKAATTTTTAAPSTTTSAAPATLTSTDKVAVFLDGTVLTPAEVQAALGLAGAPTVYTGVAGSATPPPPQGALSLKGVVAVFPTPAYESLLQQGQASVGANHTYVVADGPYTVDVLAVKFKSSDTGRLFVTSAASTAVSFGGAQQTQHPELSIGTLPNSVLRVSANQSATSEQAAIGSLYQDGVYYLVSAVAAPGKVADDILVKLLKAQDAKYQAKKSSLPTS